ncbi:MAG: DUF4834 family protein [Bacteroides sp.]|nr:DUF4834 family protein [Bacteroides sp.]MCM1388710.1 DUF4834 family protein [Bacteroides sp.]
MGAFLFFLILIFIVLPLALLSRLFGGLFSFFRRTSTGSSFFRNGGSADSSSAPEPKPKKKKVFSRNCGEYVEFEEIIEEKSAAGTSASSTGKEVKYEVEEQVSDAEWTEIE